MIGLIYKITNKIDGKIYIGQTMQDLDKRWIQHKCDAKKRAAKSALHRAMALHGIDNFKISLMVRCSSIEEMNYREEYYIRLFRTLAPIGYNLSIGGKNKTCTAETRKKISDSKTGTKTGKPAWNRGVACSEAAKKKISIKSSGPGNGMFGKTHTEEARKNIAAAQRVREHTPEEREKISKASRQPVLCHETGTVFKSAKESAIFFGISSQSVSQVCLRQRRQCCGHTFSYVNIGLDGSYDLIATEKDRKCWIELDKERVRNRVPKEIKPVSDETRKKISIARTGKRASPETRAKMSKNRSGKKHSLESIEKMSAAHKGKPKSEEHKKNLSESHSGKKLTKEHKDAISNGLKKKIICNETQKIYQSIKDAAMELGCKPCSVWLVLNGQSKRVKGLTFSYL